MDNWQLLVGNFAVVGLLISAWVHAQDVVARLPKHWRDAIFGLVMGIGAVASMLLAVQTDTGSLFDLRLSVVALAGYFGGPLGGLIAAVIGIAFRLQMGGTFKVLALQGIGLAAIAGWAVRVATRGRSPEWVGAAVLSLAAALIGFLFMLIFSSLKITTYTPLSLPKAILTGGATAMSAYFMIRNQVQQREKNLLRAALNQSTDMQFIKTPESRFAAVNENVARQADFASPSQLIGKSDFDIVPRARAQSLYDVEQQILASGLGFSNHEERVVDANGVKTWYMSSKVALHDPDGNVIGLSGITRNITNRKHTEVQLAESRDQLTQVLGGISDGVAMFSKDDVLVYCNEQFKVFFAVPEEARRAGLTLLQMLRASAVSIDQVGVRLGNKTAWVGHVVRALSAAGECEINLTDGRWVNLKSRPVADGSAILVVADVTLLKQAERNVTSMTEKLTLLAATDPLTSIGNRRTFDNAVVSELARGRRDGKPLSLLLIDIDSFKSFNDVYGHQAGDEALRAVAGCLRDVLKRPGDVATRYGGEEFAAVLPDTDDDGAFFIADAFRLAVRALNVVHQGSPKGVLTVSVGIAVARADDRDIEVSQLVRRADEALYTAKHAGRDRVTGWRERAPIVSLVAQRA